MGEESIIGGQVWIHVVVGRILHVQQLDDIRRPDRRITPRVALFCVCYASRHISTMFSEGKYLCLAMISNLQVFIVGLPVLVIVGTDTDTSYFVRTVIIWMNDFMVVAIIFGHLMWSEYTSRRSHKSSRTEIRRAMTRYAHTVKKKFSVLSHFGSGAEHISNPIPAATKPKSSHCDEIGHGKIIINDSATAPDESSKLATGTMGDDGDPVPISPGERRPSTQVSNSSDNSFLKAMVAKVVAENNYLAELEDEVKCWEGSHHSDDELPQTRNSNPSKRGSNACKKGGPPRSTGRWN